MHPYFENISDEELHAEMERRKNVRRKRPAILHPIDIDALVEICESYISSCIENNETPDDTDDEHFIFEAAMEAVYGKSIWQWINQFD